MIGVTLYDQTQTVNLLFLLSSPTVIINKRRGLKKKPFDQISMFSKYNGHLIDANTF